MNLDKVILNKNSETFEVYLSLDKPIDINKISELINASKNGINNEGIQRLHRVFSKLSFI